VSTEVRPPLFGNQPNIEHAVVFRENQTGDKFVKNKKENKPVFSFIVSP
jgi:hypothetical protein